MLYCNCYNYKQIIGLLNDNNTVGTRYTTVTIGPHYSGNFWWASSKYIKTLPSNIGRNYLDPEAWLLRKKRVLKFSMNLKKTIG